MATILIVYGTKEGHTATIAERMRETITERGHEVRVERVGDQSPQISEEIDGVLVGASIHAGKHQAEVREFVERKRQRLSAMPSAFFQTVAKFSLPNGAKRTLALRLPAAVLSSTALRTEVESRVAGVATRLERAPLRGLLQHSTECSSS